MKKLLALILTLCMMLAALPAPAESAEDPIGSGLAGLLSGLMGSMESEDGTENEISKLIRVMTALKEKFPANDEKIKEILSKLMEKLQGLLSSEGEDLGAILSGLGNKVMGQLESSNVDVTGMLNGLFGIGGEESAMTDEDYAELEQTYAEMNERALAETGDGIPNKKDAESPEEFYGSWTCVKFVINGEEYDIDDGWELVLGENTRYYIEDGQITTDDGMPPEIQETKFENGVLKLLVNDLWSVFVLTEDGSLADVGTSLVTYYAPAK